MPLPTREEWDMVNFVAKTVVAAHLFPNLLPDPVPEGGFPGEGIHARAVLAIVASQELDSRSSMP